MTNFPNVPSTPNVTSQQHALEAFFPSDNPNITLTPAQALDLGEMCLQELARETDSELPNPKAAAAERALLLMDVTPAKIIRSAYNLGDMAPGTALNPSITTIRQPQEVRDQAVTTYTTRVGHFAIAQQQGTWAIARIFPRRLRRVPRNALTFLYKVDAPIPLEERLPRLADRALAHLALRPDISEQDKKVIRTACGLDGSVTSLEEIGIAQGVSTTTIKHILERNVKPFRGAFS